MRPPLKGLVGNPMFFEVYVELMGVQARSEERLRLLERRRRAS